MNVAWGQRQKISVNDMYVYTLYLIVQLCEKGGFCFSLKIS